MAAQTTSKKGRRFIEKQEGLILHAYNDPVGHCTAGIGHLVHRGNCTAADYRKYGRRTPDNNLLLAARKRVFRAMFRRDLKPFERAVRQVAGRPLLQQQFDALVSLAFNIGVVAFEHSTVAERVQARRGNVGEAILRWRFSNGQPILLERRKREVALYREGKYE